MERSGRLDGESEWSDVMSVVAKSVCFAVFKPEAEPTTTRDEVTKPSNQDNSINPECKWHKQTNGKRGLKASLVRRTKKPNNSRLMDDYIEAKREVDEFGFCPRTPIDALVSEILHSSRQALPRYTCYGQATLGRARRWVRVEEIMDNLEREGTAERVALPSHVSRYRRHAYDDEPYCVARYVVKPTGKIKQQGTRKTSRMGTNTSGQVIYRQNRGKLKAWYQLNSEPPPEVQHPPLRGNLRAPPGNIALDRRARNAFSPGVKSSLASYRPAVVANAVDLVFGRPVCVTHASVAGKTHDTLMSCHSEFRKVEHHGPPRYNRNGNIINTSSQHQRVRKRLFVAKEGTDAYCDRVEISARLTSNPGEWVSLGQFTACHDCYTEKAIYLGDNAAATRGGSVCCVALRFRALSWHNQPLFRVGAYGLETNAEDENDFRKRKTLKQKFQSNGDGEPEDGVYYTLYSAKHKTDDDDSLQRKYAIKTGKSFKKKRWFYGNKQHCPKAQKRAQFALEIEGAVKNEGNMPCDI